MISGNCFKKTRRLGAVQKLLLPPNLMKHKNRRQLRSQPMEIIKKVTDRDFFLPAEDPVEYGLIDKVIRKRNK